MADRPDADRRPGAERRQPRGRLRLGAYHTNLAVAATVFGVVSVAMSLVGLELGARIGAAAGERSELIACALLIVVGVVIAAGALRRL